MKIIEINDYKDFLSLREEWASLLLRCEHTIFSTWEWLSTLWKYFRNNRKLKLLLAEENGEVVGIAPLAYSVHTMFGLRRGKLEFIGSRISDYNDLIIIEKHLEGLKSFIDYLHKGSEKWECIDLIDIPENSKCLSPLASLTQNLNPINMCPFKPLPSSYENFLQGFNSNRRRYFRKNMRRLEENFVVEIVDYSAPELVNEGMRFLFELHQKRWMSKGYSGAFADPKARIFNLEVAKAFAQKNWLSLYGLKLSGDVVAMEYGFKYNSKYLAYLTGFDPKYSKYSVGNMLRLLVIRKLIQEGITEFDFLRGAEEYKYQWKTNTRWNYRAVLTKKSRLANFRHWLYEQYWCQGNRFKYFLKAQRAK